LIPAAVKTVLVTDISSYKAVVAVRHLRRRHPDVRILTTDHRPFVRTLHSRHAKHVHIIPVSPESGEPYAAALGRLISLHRVDVLIPVNSKEIRVLVKFRELLGSALSYMGGSGLYDELDDKSAFAQLIDKAGLPQPKSYQTLDAPLPLVVKPSRGSSAKGVVYLTNDAERAAFRQANPDAPNGFVIQEFVTGEGIGYSGFFDAGRPLVSYAHRRVAEYPVSGGSSAVRERYPYADLPVLEALVRRLLEAAPWSGFAMFELKRRGPGDFVFIECNPRVWGSIHQGLADGSDYFAPLLGEGRTPAVQHQRAVKTSLLPLNVLSAIGYMRTGRFSILREIVLPVRGHRLDINPLTDPLGFLALLMRGA
jgi:predicted ATP-grasp superfamily ATP-dependent carboligase